MALGVVAALASGCARGPHFVAVDERSVIDRTEIEYPNGLQLTPYIDNLNSPVAIGFEEVDPRFKGSTIVAESGIGFLAEPRIIGFKPNGEQFPIYPRFTRIPLIDEQFRIRGPIGGMAVANGKIYVTHRDSRGAGMITRLDYDGGHETIIADLPAQGDYGLTDIAVSPISGRVWFGCGSATNSGVVGLDNWQVGWVDDHPAFSDKPFGDVKLNGFQFRTKNPKGGLFGGDDYVVTGPLQAFGALGRLRIPGSPPPAKPTGAIYSVDPAGGDLVVEGHGLRLPRGLVFDEFGNLYATNNGMELRGTRPVKNDPDALLRIPRGGQVWYGFPDYSADLRPISDSTFQPPPEIIMPTGYPELARVIDPESSGLVPPDTRHLLGVFPPMSGAAKMVVVPDQPIDAFKAFRGKVIVALSGDRAPFANFGKPLETSPGYMLKLVDLDPETKQPPADFVANTRRTPASKIRSADYEMERPIDAKFGPDGALYIVDFGRLTVKEGQEKTKSRTGRVYRLGPPALPATNPAAGVSPKKARNWQE